MTNLIPATLKTLRAREVKDYYSVIQKNNLVGLGKELWVTPDTLKEILPSISSGLEDMVDCGGTIHIK